MGRKRGRGPPVVGPVRSDVGFCLVRLSSTPTPLPRSRHLWVRTPSGSDRPLSHPHSPPLYTGKRDFNATENTCSSKRTTSMSSLPPPHYCTLLRSF